MTPAFMNARDAARVLAASLKQPTRPRTIADASAESGLALRDAERGLHFLTSEYRGHLRVTAEGDLLFLFPHGFEKPWETRDAVRRALGAIGRSAAGIGRFVVRAWVMIVLVAYAAIFLALSIGLAFAGRSSDDRRDSGFPGGAILYVFLRVLGDALFWTFHPFSPFAVGHYGYESDDAAAGWQNRRGAREERKKTPFYEKVNLFFFGPTPPKVDPRATERQIVAAIRAGKGRIGLADVMSVTGLSRDEADPMMARLMLDYEGDVHVSEAGGITYSFPALRRTADDTSPAPNAPPPAWTRKKELEPLTGNDVGSNLLIGGLNAFNVFMAVFAIERGLTIERVTALFSHVPRALLPPPELPIALGVVPLVMSIALFLLPIARLLLRPRKERAVKKENARLAVLRTILSRVRAKERVTEGALVAAWKNATGDAPDSKELTRVVVSLGGDIDLEESDQHGPRYRFVDLETEATALEQERDLAPEEERKVGRVIFASDSEPTS